MIYKVGNKEFTDLEQAKEYEKVLSIDKAKKEAKMVEENEFLAKIEAKERELYELKKEYYKKYSDLDIEPIMNSISDIVNVLFK